MLKKNKLICLIAILAVSSWLFAADSTWDGDANDGLWSSADNWAGNAVPPAGNRIIIQIEDEVTYDIASLSINKMILTAASPVADGAILNLPSGTLTNSSYWFISNGAAHKAVVNITGSSVSITTRDLNVGAAGGSGIVNMSAGLVNVTGTLANTGLSVPYDAGSLGELNLSGGKIIAAQLTMYDYG